MKTGGDTPLILFQPFNIVVFLSFYSPIILAISVLGMSFVFQNFKGFIYLGFLLGCCVVREYIYKMSGSNPIINDKTICTSIQYSKYGNSGFSIFFIAFSLVYICGPMILNKSVNYWMLSGFLFYLSLDICIRFKLKCITQLSDIFLNLLIGITAGIIAITAMYTAKISNYLFFNETSSTKDVCSMPSKQTFKCSVYQGGELVGSTNV